LATIATTNVHTAGAVTSGYKEPCSEGDQANSRGVCCPEGSSNTAHNLCLTPDEDQQREESNTKIERCAGGAALGLATGGMMGGLRGAAGSC
jgi:hypothetical protein